MEASILVGTGLGKDPGRIIGDTVSWICPYSRDPTRMGEYSELRDILLFTI